MKSIPTLSVIFGAFVFMLSGCTSLVSTPTGSKPHTFPGLTYKLPAKKFSLEANYLITACDSKNDKLHLDADVSVKLSEALIGDQSYTLDFQELNTWTKITNTEFSISEEGLLTAVNASIKDQSATIIKNSAASVAGIARAVALPEATLATNFLTALNETATLRSRTPMWNRDGGTALRSLSPQVIQKLEQLYKNFDINNAQAAANAIQNLEACTPINNLLAAYKEAGKAVKNENAADKKRSELKKQIDTFSNEIEGLKGLAETYSNLGKESDKTGLLSRIKTLEAKKAAGELALTSLGESNIDKLNVALNKLKIELTISAIRSFVPKIDKKSYSIEVVRNELPIILRSTLVTDNLKLPVISMNVEPLSTSASNLQPEPDSIGIAYRMPVASTVIVEVSNEDNSKKINLINQVTQIPQFGPIGSLNLNNKIFDDNLIEVAFNANTGAPSKIVFRAASKGEAASGAASDVANTYLQLKKDQNADIVNANATALQQMNAQLAFEKTQSELALSKVQSQTSIATLQAESQQAIVAANLQLVRDRQRLEAVRTGTATRSEVELEALNTQEKLLEQKLKILKLEKEISEQGSTSE